MQNKKEFFATMTMYKNERTKGGSWSKVKQDLTVDDITEEVYNNIVEHPWATDRMSREYTSKGYLVTRVATTNPYAPERTVREFKIS